MRAFDPRVLVASTADSVSFEPSPSTSRSMAISPSFQHA